MRLANYERDLRFPMLFYGMSIKFWMSEDWFEKRKKAPKDRAVYIAQYICHVIFLK